MKNIKRDFAAAAALPSGMFAGARLAAAQPGDAMPAAGDLS